MRISLSSDWNMLAMRCLLAVGWLCLVNGYHYPHYSGPHFYDNHLTSHGAHYYGQVEDSGDAASSHGEQGESQDHGHGEDGGYNYENEADHDYHVDYYAHPKYEYKYGVEDGHTGDNKRAWETRDGDVVKGGYEIYDPDGTKRVVEYTADKHTGFHVTITRHGGAHHPQIYGDKKYGHDHDHEYPAATSHSNFNLHHYYH